MYEVFIQLSVDYKILIRKNYTIFIVTDFVFSTLYLRALRVIIYRTWHLCSLADQYSFSNMKSAAMIKIKAIVFVNDTSVRRFRCTFT